MNKKILPIKQPTITSWTWQAGTFALLEANNIGYEWIYSNYIQIVANDFSDTCNLDFIPRGESFAICPYFYTQKIKRSIVKSLEPNSIEFFKTAIDQGNYIYTVVDIKLLVEESDYKHDLMIYGYDDEEQVFYVADFIFSGKYSFVKVSYRDLQKAYDSVTDDDDFLIGGRGGLLLISIYENGNYDFDTKLVHTNFLEYLNGEAAMEKFRLYMNPWRGEVFGLNVYDLIIEFMYKVSKSELPYDNRAIHNLYDHKVLMIKRLQYMKEKGYLSIEDNVIDQYIEISQRMKRFVNIWIKINITNNYQEIDKITKGLNEIKELEGKLIPQIIDKIVHKSVDKTVD